MICGQYLLRCFWEQHVTHCHHEPVNLGPGYSYRTRCCIWAFLDDLTIFGLTMAHFRGVCGTFTSLPSCSPCFYSSIKFVIVLTSSKKLIKNHDIPMLIESFRVTTAEFKLVWLPFWFMVQIHLMFSKSIFFSIVVGMFLVKLFIRSLIMFRKFE